MSRRIGFAQLLLTDQRWHGRAAYPVSAGDTRRPSSSRNSLRQMQSESAHPPVKDRGNRTNLLVIKPPDWPGLELGQSAIRKLSQKVLDLFSISKKKRACNLDEIGVFMVQIYQNGNISEE